MNIVYRQEVIVQPSQELSNKVDQVVQLVNSAVRENIGEKKYIQPTKVSVHLDSECRATAHVYVQMQLLYSFVLTRHERDTFWVCQTDLAKAFGIAMDTMEGM